ncbi:NAD(P)-dependent alcohol dehydrogenase [Sinomicrobium soli]|uniref:NAD(P)-dependent alcohol dehydrogenase n=1 Tax=Sinomicrobium sp. N-1-3-6 TaxID=2219864 RepID=UPI000DCAEFDD|nr:NAD(P)-dependent alcohol dehydrogenase [Sinomicrobium sp. N-1-3-6]RAV31063.1 NAD(P)-dependent alcohol dehydrogenase [Sinomicrobium sp. N-1-3-6]
MNTHSTKAFGTEAAAAPLEALNIRRREVTPHDVEIEILYCGICHSDLHAVHNDWGGTFYPIVPGHEIVGRISKVGENVTRFKAGDLAGVGCIVDSCRECSHCKEGDEQFCESGWTVVFNSPDKKYGGITYGGFSERIVVDENYVVRVPETLDMPGAAPILCAGITVYSPLKHWKTGPGKNVGIIGIGGLGHMAIKIAKAMGAHVTVFTTSQAKADDARRLGADDVVLSTDAEQMGSCPGQDMILDTVSARHDINTYINLLKVDGSLVMVGLPAEQLEIGASNVVHGRKSFSGSNIGGIAETQEVLDFCAEHNITAEIELIDVNQINNAFERLAKSDVKYRFVVDMAGLKN